MHQASDSALVIWYDAVTSQGKLKWQNGLTDQNCGFLEACDGLYVNYAWKLRTLDETAAAAGVCDKVQNFPALFARTFSRTGVPLQ